MFNRADKAVGVVTPAYYADITCERGRRYLGAYFEGGLASAADDVVDPGAGARERQQRLVRLHPRLRDSMFYIKGLAARVYMVESLTEESLVMLSRECSSGFGVLPKGGYIGIRNTLRQ